LILYAIPTPLGGKPQDALPASALKTIAGIEHFVAEDAKSARAFLSGVGMQRPLQQVAISVLDEHTAAKDVPSLLQPLREGHSLGLLSEAGCPAIADPGAALVEAAHLEGFRVEPLVGPSSLVLALMASGLEGQRFAFCGYLPREQHARGNRIRELEKRSRSEKETELFIETPYRNEVLLASLLETCNANTRMCIAADLTMPTQSITTKSIAEWRKAGATVGKRPAVFLLYAS
jgi:16S rRNA (cytidine1402-2'-O)-methyltransferase